MKAKGYLLGFVTLAALFSFCFTGHRESAWPLAQVDSYVLNVAILAGINVILAVSLNLVNGYTGQFSLGHAGFMAIGAYASSAFTLFEGKEVLLMLGGGLPAELCVFGLAVLLGGALASLTGLLVGIPSLRLRGDYLAIVTLGFGEIIRVVIQNTEFLGGARGLTGIRTYTSLGWTLGIAALAIYVVKAVVYSAFGRGFLAVRDDEIAAEAMGISAVKYKVLAFTLSSFFAGVAGALYAHFIGYINPEGFSFLKSVDVVVMVILGGMGSTFGVATAAVVLTFLNEVLREAEQYRMVVFALLLIVMMILRPQGLVAGMGTWLSGRRHRG